MDANLLKATGTGEESRRGGLSPGTPFSLLEGPEVWSPSVTGTARDGVLSTCQQKHLYANAKQALVRLITTDPIERVPT